MINSHKNCCGGRLMELLAIPLGSQNTAAKWLVMRRCAVLEILMYFSYIPVSALTSDLAGAYCQLSRMAMQSSVRLASIPPREFLRLFLGLGNCG
jgi:hypothetical protein